MSREHHHHAHISSNISRAFVVGIVLNMTFVIVEFVMGFYTNSLALLSDAGHNLSDVASLALALFAIRISKAKATEKFTYGYHKSTILVSLVNAVILFIAVGGIGLEAIQRFLHPVATHGNVISIVAALGIIINTVSALLFFRTQENDLNVKSAYLHLALDALVSLGVVTAGVVITYTGLTWIDPAISLAIMLIVVFSTWNLLTESLRLTLDAVPQNVNMKSVTQAITKTTGVMSLHHMHVWAMSTTKNAMTAHLVLEKDLTSAQIAELKRQLKYQLEQHNIQHVTLETELECCADANCNGLSKN